jgi:hypothetical protein
MIVVCDICKKEVRLIIFGNGLVGACCDTVLYNSADKSQFDMEPDENELRKGTNMKPLGGLRCPFGGASPYDHNT